MANRFNIQVEKLNGGLNDQSAASQIRDNQLKTALNVRYLADGGFYSRPGYLNSGLATGEGVEWDGVGSLPDNSLMLCVTNGKIFHNGNGSMTSLVGTGLTAGVRTRIREYNGDFYLTNTTDAYTRVAVSTLASNLTAGVSTSLTVAAGQGWRFGTSGTIRIDGDDITYTSRTNDVLTITAATVTSNHTAGATTFVTEVTQPSGAPKALDVAFWAEKAFAIGVLGVAGNKYTDATTFYSATANIANPEYIYNFTSGGAGTELIGKGGGNTAIISTRDNLFIFKKRGIEYFYGIDSTSGAPLHKSISEIYGVPNPDCVTQMGNNVVFFTGKEIKTIGIQDESVYTFTIDPYFDANIQRTLQVLDDDQDDAAIIFDTKKKLLKLWVNYQGQRICFTYFIPNRISATQQYTGGWSVDTGKNAKLLIYWNDEVYWAGFGEDILYQDEVGYEDNGTPIEVIADTKDFTGSNFINPDEWQKGAIDGYMVAGSQFDWTIYVDDVAVATMTVDDSYISSSGGFPIGNQGVGLGIIGGGGSSQALAFNFKKIIEKALIAVGSKCYIRFYSNSLSSAFGINLLQLSGETFGEEALTDDN